MFMILRNNPLAFPRSEDDRYKTAGLWLMGTERLLQKVTQLGSEFGSRDVPLFRNILIVKVLQVV